MWQTVQGCNPPISPIEVSTEPVSSVKPDLSLLSRYFFHSDTGSFPLLIQWEPQGIFPRNRGQVGHDPPDYFNGFSLPSSRLFCKRNRLLLPCLRRFPTALSAIPPLATAHMWGLVLFPTSPKVLNPAVASAGVNFLT